MRESLALEKHEKNRGNVARIRFEQLQIVYWAIRSLAVTGAAESWTKSTHIVKRSTEVKKLDLIDGMILKCLLALCLISVFPEVLSYHGFYFRDAAGVDRYGLHGLGTDIVEKIRKATGYPISTDVFSNILSSQSKGYESVLSIDRDRRKGSDGSSYKYLGGGLSSFGRNNRYTDSEISGRKGGEKWEGSYGESSESKKDFMTEEEFTDDHYHKEETEDEDLFKGMRKRHRAFLSKGYEDEYRRDETKKADHFWDNEEKEGKWIRYGTENREHGKDAKWDVVKKEKSEGEEGGEYLSAKGEETEKKDEMSAKKEEKNFSRSEKSRKDIEITESKI